MLKTPSPARIHTHQSLLQLTAFDFGYFGTHLLRAAQTTDPVDRLKWVAAFLMGGQIKSSSWIGCRIPLNPILGETL